ncbi:MAG: TonB-dependent receptor [Ignavibacteriae bacterium]|nr:TonB-dependent receptor [Ignavibacteriota bacterium]
MRIPIILLCTFLFALSAIAQDATSTVQDTSTYYLSPVIINPTQAKERETPATFSNMNREQLAERYSVQDVPVLLSELPSMTFYSENGNGIGYNYINLRGFDQRRLSVMVNGIPQNDPEDHNVYWIDFPDLLASTGTVQVQRGAGSAFYGPPAIGGSINLVTNPFTQRPGVTLESMFGLQEFGDSSRSLPLNTKKFDVTINSGLIEKQYMLYGRLGKILSDGYRQNSWVELNSYFLGAARFDQNTTTRFHFFGGPLTDGLAYFGLPKFAKDDKKLRRQNLVDWGLDSTGQGFSYAIPRRPQETESFSQPHYELMNEWRVSPTLTLHNTLFYYTGDGYFDYDASWADTSMLRLGTAYGIPTTQNPTNALVRAFVGNKQWGWLPRVEVDHGNGTMTFGAELRNLTILADIQFVYNRYGIANEKYLGNTFSFPYDFVNPRAGINYNMTDEWNTYLSVGYTSREPQLRNLYAAEDSYFGATPQFQADTATGIVRFDFNKPLAKPERLLDVELGAGFRNANAQLTANVYWMEFTDELVKNGQLDIFGQPVTGNAERTRHLGVELDGSATLSSTFQLSGNVSLSRNRLIRYSLIDDSGTRVSFDDNPIAGFPDVLGNVRLTYKTESVTSSIVTKYVGEFSTDNSNNETRKNDAYTVVNTEFLYRLPRVLGSQFTLRGEIRNIFNNLYFQNGEGDAFFPAAERNYICGITANL